MGAGTETIVWGLVPRPLYGGWYRDHRMGTGTETIVWGLVRRPLYISYVAGTKTETRLCSPVVNEGHLLFGIFLPNVFRVELQEPVGGAALLWSAKVNNKGSVGF